MENFLQGGVAELEEVKAAILDLNQKEQEYKDTDKSLKAKQKEQDVQRKRVDEKINAAVKRARTELERGYDAQIEETEKSIRAAENKKKAAKAEAVNLRMQRENSSLVGENRILKAEIKAQFKEENVPFFCDSRFYYALFFPKKLFDIIVCIVAAVIFAGIIPFLITRLISSSFAKVLVWLLIIVFFAAIYLLIAAWTKKGARSEILDHVRPSVERISANKSFIKKRNKNIKADPDESQYNLTAYDQDLEMARSEHDQALSEKEAAMKRFEEEESVNIRSQMEQENSTVFEQLDKEITKMSSDFETRSQAYQEAAQKVEEYTSLLGEKNCKADRIDELIAILNEGTVTTIQDALEQQKAK